MRLSNIFKKFSTALSFDVFPVVSETAPMISKVEIGNGSASTAQMAWGFENQLKVGKIVSGAFVEQALPLTLSSDDFVVFSDGRIDALELSVGTSSATAITVTVWDGDSFETAATPLEVLDITATGKSVQVVIDPQAGVVSDAAAASFPRGRYAVKIAGGTGAVIGAVKAGEVKDLVQEVLKAEALYETYEGEKLLQGNRNKGLFFYTSEPNANSYINVEFSRL